MAKKFHSFMPSGEGKPYAHPTESVMKPMPECDHFEERVELPSMATIDKDIAANVKGLRKNKK